MAIVQSVFDVGASIKDINLQALKLYQIKKNIELVEKKIDKLLISPLQVADEMFKTGFNEIEAKRYKDAQKSFATVIEEANKGLVNIQDKTVSIKTFKLCAHSLKLIMCSKIAKYCYNLETKSFLPYTNLSKSDQKLVAKELEKLSIKCLAMKNNVEVKPLILTRNQKEGKEVRITRDQSEDNLSSR